MANKKRSLAAFVDGFRRPALFCGRHRYYDSLLSKLHMTGVNTHLFNSTLSLIDIHEAWEVFRQIFIDECFNKGSIRKWSAVPFLDLMDSPCATGSVIMVFKQKVKDILTRQPKKSFFAGSTNDFHPECEKYLSGFLAPITPNTMGLKRRNYMRVYQARDSERAVIITLIVEDKLEIEHKMALDNLHIDLDNFDGTSIQHKYCYVVTKVITARSIRIEMTDDGEVFYEMEYEGAVPICFQAAKVHVCAESSGLLKRIKPVTGVLRLNCVRRGIHLQHFMNAFIPNQNRLGRACGDVNPTIPVQGRIPIQSYRPQNLPRPDRPKRNLLWHFNNYSELRSLRYCFRRDVSINGLLPSQREDEDHIGDYVHTFCPTPQRHAVEYDDFEL